jgi:predicted ferric reductase
MEHLLNFEEIGVFFSIVGILFILHVLRVKKSRLWEESAGLKRTLLVVLGLLFQLPVVLVVVVRPPYVTTVLSVEGFSFHRLAAGYVIQGLIFAGLGLSVRWLQE